MTTLSEEETRKQIWGYLPRYSHAPVPCSAGAPCGLCGRSIDGIMQTVAQREVNYRTDIAQAIGYCQGLGHPNSYLEKRYPELALQPPEQERMVDGE